MHTTPAVPASSALLIGQIGHAANGTTSTCCWVLHAGHFIFQPSRCTTEDCVGDFTEDPVDFKDIDYITAGKAHSFWRTRQGVIVIC